MKFFIIEQVEKHIDIIQSKQTNQVTNAKKTDCWRKITESVNARGGVCRTIEQGEGKSDFYLVWFVFYLVHPVFTCARGTFAQLIFDVHLRTTELVFCLALYKTFNYTQITNLH